MCTVFFAVLCDDVRQETEGKVSLMGIFNEFSMVDYEQPLPRFTIHIRFGFKKEGQHVVRLEVQSEQGDFSIVQQVKVQTGDRFTLNDQYLVNLNVGVASLKIPHEGRYFVNVNVDNSDVAKIPFIAITKAPKSVSSPQ